MCRNIIYFTLMIICFMAIGLTTGCTVSGWEISKSIELCKDHGETDYINPVMGVQCNDGKVFGLVR